MDEGGAQLRAITLTRDHKALYPEERARIAKAGGFVDRQGRLGGRIEVARAFGDAQFKPVGLSAVPDVKVTVWLGGNISPYAPRILHAD